MFIDLRVVPKIILATHVETETNVEQELDLQTIELFHWNAANAGVMCIRVKIVVIGLGS